MHWNVAPDLLPGSAMFVRVMDCWLNGCKEYEFEMYHVKASV